MDLYSQRIGRLSYISWLVLIVFIEIICFALLWKLGEYLENLHINLNRSFVTCCFSSIIFATLAGWILVTAMRLRDMNRSIWWSILIIIPVGQLVVMLIAMSVKGAKKSL